MLLINRYRQPAPNERAGDEPWDFPYNEYAWQSMRWSGWMKLVKEFYGSHLINVVATRADGVQRHEVPSPRGRVLAGEDPVSKFKRSVCFILQLYCTVKGFMRDFQTFVMSVSMHEVPVLPMLQRTAVYRQKRWPLLLPREELRLHRGFLRYELYCRTEGVPATLSETGQLGGDTRMHATKAWEELDRLLEPWELEEISTICIYARRVYDLIVLDVYEGFKHTIKQLHDNFRRDQSGNSNSVTSLHLSSSFSFPILETDRSAEEGFRCLDWAATMAYSGLSLLSSILQLDLEQRRDFFNRVYYALPDTGYCFTHYSITEPPFTWPYAEAEVEGANPAFRAANLHAEELMPTDYRDKYHFVLQILRELGWVFWEHSKRLHMLSIPPDANHVCNTCRWAGIREASVYDAIEHAYSMYPVRFTAWETLPPGTMVREDDWDTVVFPAYGVPAEENKYDADPATRARLRNAAYYPLGRGGCCRCRAQRRLGPRTEPKFRAFGDRGSGLEVNDLGMMEDGPWSWRACSADPEPFEMLQEFCSPAPQHLGQQHWEGKLGMAESQAILATELCTLIALNCT